MNDINDSPEATSGSASENVASHFSASVERRPDHIVGIGASAGGLEALERLCEAMPLETGLAFVVVQHLSPDFKSLTDELLARRTRVPIKQVEDGIVVERDAIYLLPPKKDMIIAGGKLFLTDKDPAQMVPLPIDHFFRSLAHEIGGKAIGVILSGTGSDGSRGIRDIHGAGGLVVAQSPESSRFDGMPKSAVQTGVVDLIVPPEEIPAALMRYIRHPLRQEFSPIPEAVPRGMDAVFRLLRDAYDIDFSHYKPDTVSRRTERRLQINQIADLDDYVKKLSRDPEELNRLYKDLLIGVTRFFRDKEAFARLENHVLPAIIEQAGINDEVRFWVSGCATGEEAYSLAILLQETLEKSPRKAGAKIFATDVHRVSLDIASAGLYGAEQLVDVDAERLARHFTPKGDGYQVGHDIRRLVVFAHHNILKDAPFTRLDLVTCRNLLIYFQPMAQKRALSLFHFALKPGGIMFLGPSESAGELAEEFDTVDARWKIYRKRRDVRLSPEIRLLPSTTRGVGYPSPTAPSASVQESQMLGLYHNMLDKFMPPSLLVNERREVVHSFAGSGRFLRHIDGRFSNDVLDMVSDELRVALTGALQRVFKEKKPVVYKGLRVSDWGIQRFINLTVESIPNPRTGLDHALIRLEEIGDAPASPVVEEINLGQASKEQVVSLEHELRYTKENLQATIEELETSNEELQATNEELVAANEELQSTNEELHSVNEELFTVNAEYQKKIAELTELTTDIDNLFTSTQVHTIFLDRQLRIRKFTPQIAETFNLLAQDVGRKIDSFTHGIDEPNLIDAMRNVLSTGDVFEKEVRVRRGGWFLLRLLPYKAGSAIDGVVLTLIDVTSLKQAESDARTKDLQLRSILKTSPNFIFIKDRQRRYILADDSYQRVFACDPIGKTARDIYPPEVADLIDAQELRVLEEGISIEGEMEIPLANGAHTFFCVRFPLRDEKGQITGVSGVKIDVTLLKRAEQRWRDAVQQRDLFLAMLSHELRNPLAAIINAARVIRLRQPDNSDVSDWAAVIERRTLHTTRLLDDLLDVTRITQNKIEIRKQPVELGALMEDIVEATRPAFATRSVELTVIRPAGGVWVHGDEARLQQIQVNLLMNAAKYTPAGGKVWFEIGTRADEAVIRVRDTGCGIPPSLLEKVFEVFVQADTNLHRSEGGIGVGLTLVRALTELHGGRAQAYSAGPGKGSEFVVRLPLGTQPSAANAESTPSLPRSTSPSSTPPAAPLDLLVVDDDNDIRESMRDLLANDGHRVVTAADGREALSAFQDAKFDAAIIDIGLPEIDGYELARRIRERIGKNTMTLIALTGYGRSSDIAAAEAAGFDAHLTKPLKFAEFTALLGTLRHRE